MAVKATYTERNGVGFNITKDPITDDGTKKSATGLLAVTQTHGAHGSSNPTLVQGTDWVTVYSTENLLKAVFVDGDLLIDDSWSDITSRAKNNVSKLEF